MEKRKPITNSEELFHRVSRLSAEAEWTTEELQDTLREGGVDPDQLVTNVRAKVERLLEDSQQPVTNTVAAVKPADSRSALAELRERTQMPASAIAREMDVTVAFLSAVGRYPKVVPIQWWKELDSRAERKLQVPGGTVMSTREHPYQEQMAASRETTYAQEDVTYENILDQAGMDEEAKRYWLALATEG